VLETSAREWPEFWHVRGYLEALALAGVGYGQEGNRALGNDRLFRVALLHCARYRTSPRRAGPSIHRGSSLSTLPSRLGA